jgi:hypothetical protein
MRRLVFFVVGTAIGAVVGFVGVVGVAFLELVSEARVGWPTGHDLLSHRFFDYETLEDATISIGWPYAAVCAAIGSVLGFLYWSKHKAS